MPAGTRVLLFGSRLDDSRRGGNIDLLVELPGALSADDTVVRRSRFTARLYRLLEERRIDVVMTQQGSQDRRAVVTAARQQGWWTTGCAGVNCATASHEYPDQPELRFAVLKAAIGVAGELITAYTRWKYKLGLV
ncbi:MAG TPA: hypothetical protein VET87_18040 [Rubrivivax sp.]|nr:hypothetical protein [Rubrivivax sp.]